MIPPHFRRQVFISFAVGMAIAIFGAILFGDSEAAMQAVGLTAFAAAFAVLYFLDGRDKSRERREGKEPQ